jgi:hypothetical protein
MFKVKRGSSLPVEVNSAFGMVTLKRAAINKHAVFNKTMVDATKDYVLLYPDFEIIDNLPGTRQPFNIKEYKEMLGKPYHRITFHLCEKQMYNGKIQFDWELYLFLVLLHIKLSKQIV